MDADIEISQNKKADSQQTVLFVDDEAPLRQLAAQGLKLFGYNVITAADGMEAIDVFRSHSNEIGAVVIDRSMPGISGEETCYKMLEIRPDAKVVIASGFAENSENLHVGPEAHIDYMSKPFTPKALATKLHEILDA